MLFYAQENLAKSLIILIMYHLYFRTDLAVNNKLKDLRKGLNDNTPSTKCKKLQDEQATVYEPVDQPLLCVEASQQDPERSISSPVCTDDSNLKAQVESLELEINFLRAEKDSAQAKIMKLQQQLQKATLFSSCVENDDKNCKFYTGISYAVFLHVFTYLLKFIVHKPTKDSLPVKDQLFLTLVRLRLGLPFKFIAHQCNSSEETIRRYFWTWITLINSHLAFFVVLAITYGSSLFHSKYPRLTSRIDCFEIFIDQSKNLEARAQTWFNYKHHNTI